MTALLEDVATGRRVVAALAAFAIASVVLFNAGPARPLTESAGAPLLDVRFGWDADDAHAFLAAAGDEGRRLYALQLLLDSAYALAFAAAVALALAWLRKVLAARPAFARLPLLPVAAGALDLVENLGIATLVARFPSEPRLVADATGVVTAAKLVLVYAVMAVLALGLVALATRALRPRLRSSRRDELA